MDGRMHIRGTSTWRRLAAHLSAAQRSQGLILTYFHRNVSNFRYGV